MAENVDLVEIDLTPIIGQTEKLTDDITELETATKRLRTEMSKENGETLESLEARKKLNKQILSNQDELKDLRKERTENIKVLKTEVNSIGALEQRNKKLAKELRQTSIETEEGKNRIKEINVELAENKAVIDEVTDKQHALTDSLDRMIEGLENSGGAVGGMIGQFKAFFANPYAILFAAIAGAIAGIGAAFKSSRAGGVLLAKGMANVGAFTEVAKNRLGEATAEAVKNGQAMRDESVAAGGLDTSLKGLIKNLKNMVGASDDVTESFSDQVTRVADLKKELIGLNSAYVDVENELLVQIATLTGLGEVQSTIADDATRSLADQRTAAVEAAKFSEQAGEAAIKLADERLSIAEKELEIGIAAGALLKEQDGTITSLTASGIELEKSFTDAQIAAIEASNNLTTTRLTNQQRIAQINQDDSRQELDFLFDIADAQKTINEQQIADQRLALEERKKILAETDTLLKKSYEDQLTLFERDRGVQLDRNAIAKLNNKEIIDYARGLELSEQATNDLREVIIERRLAQQDLGMAQRDLDEEESERRTAALAEIKAFDDAKFEQLLANAEAVRDFRIAEAEKEFEEAVNNKLLLDEEKIALETQYLTKLEEINADFRKNQAAEDKKVAAEKKKLQKQAISGISTLQSTAFDIGTANNQSALDAQLQAASGNEEKQEQIKRKFAKKQQKVDRAKALIGGALAIIQAFAQLGPIAGAVAAIAVGATTAVQLRTINNQQFEDGGEVKAWQITGPSHAQGGIPITIGGKPAGEMEGDEGMYIVNKRDNPAAIARLSADNSVSGKSFAPSGYLADGGEATPQGGGISREEAIQLIRSAPIVVEVVDINDGQATQATVVANGEI